MVFKSMTTSAVSCRWCLFWLLYLSSLVFGVKIDPDLTIFYGPGIEKPELIFPSRYFFLQLVDSSGNNITEDLGNDFLEIRAGGENLFGGSCECRARILNRHDGTYVVQYRIFHTCKYILIEIKTRDGQVIGSEPLSIEGPNPQPIQPEECMCHKNLISPNEYLQMHECFKQNYSQLTHDLSQWNQRKYSDFQQIYNEAKERFFGSRQRFVCHYAIKNNELFGKCHGGSFMKFRHYMESVLLSILRKVKLQDMEFLHNLADFPIEVKTAQENPIPIFGWAASTGSRDIALPTYDLMARTLETQSKEQYTCSQICLSYFCPVYKSSRKAPDIQEAEHGATTRWHDRTNKAYFRGRDSNKARLELMHIAAKHTDLIDAAITYFANEDNSKLFGPTAAQEPFENNFKYKYVISIDGHSAAYRLPYLLPGGVVILKQDSPYYEHFYRDLVPYVHYVPVARNLSDLVEKIMWLRENDAKAQEIAENSKRFARQNLQPQHLYCRHVEALQGYLGLFENDAFRKIDLTNVDLIKHPDQSYCECAYMKHSKVFLQNEYYLRLQLGDDGRRHEKSDSSLDDHDEF